MSEKLVFLLESVLFFAELNVIAAMQGVHATSDAPWVYARLGAERAESGAYLWRSFMDAGVVIAGDLSDGSTPAIIIVSEPSREIAATVPKVLR